jgi:putative endonuclease
MLESWQRYIEMFYTYVLISLKDRKLYIGQTNDLRRRFLEHCRGKNFSTCHRRPLKLIFAEAFLTRAEVERREEWLKSGAGREELKRILEPTLRKFNYQYLE